MAEVRLIDVTKVFPGGVQAVDRANLEIKDREFIVLVGPSGCGKSTTLRMIAGLEELTDGEVYIGGRLVNQILPKDRDIAMVFQNYALYPHMTAYENMAFGLRLRRYPRSEIDSRVRSAAKMLGIEELLQRRPGELSGGQRQRVAVGRAIVRQPKAFLFDEPLSNLDAKFRVQMRTEIIKLHHRLQSTMIYVTHDQVEAMTMGDRIVVMKDGKMLQIAEPLVIYDRPVSKFVAGFIGTPPMNFMEGKIVRKDGGLCFDEGTLQVKISKDHAPALIGYAGKEVTFGVRSEDIHEKGNFPGMLEGNDLRAKVEVVELMGAEVYVHFSSPKNTFIGRMRSHFKPALNTMIDLAFDMNKVHFFNRETEETIC